MVAIRGQISSSMDDISGSENAFNIYLSVLLVFLRAAEPRCRRVFGMAPPQASRLASTSSNLFNRVLVSVSVPLEPWLESLDLTADSSAFLGLLISTGRAPRSSTTGT